MRFAICSEIFKEWPFDRACAFAREAGYDAIEIAPFQFSPLVTSISASQRHEMRATAERAGLVISAIHWVLAYTEGLHVTHPDPEVRARTGNYLRAAVDFCADLGGEFVIFGSPKRRDLLPGVTPEQGSGWAIESIAPAVAQGEKRGVTFCLEPLGPKESNFLNTAAEAMALARRLPSPRFQIMLDVKAMATESKPIAEVIREAHPHFKYLHVNDPNLKGPGFGEVDFVPIGQALREVGYDGFASVEVFNFDEGPERIALESRQNLRRDWGL
jgi:sugar phosphate isomerase/epimerase